MPEVPGGAARGLVFTTAKSGFFGGKNSGFIGVFDGGWSKNSQKHLPVSKVGLALRSNGTVVAWGDNTFGQSAVPAGLSDVKAISAGYGHSLALKRDGKVVSWGKYKGAEQVPAELSDVVSIVATFEASLALKSDSTCVVWGSNTYGEQNMPPNLSKVISIAGYTHFMALKSDGTIVSWGGTGAGDFGQAVVPEGLINVVAIASNGRHSLALVKNIIKYPPVPGNYTLIIRKGHYGVIEESNLLDAATDPEGKIITLLTVDARSAQGGLIKWVGGAITYTPPTADYLGEDSFHYTIKNNLDATAIGTVSIKVNPPATSPNILGVSIGTDNSVKVRFGGIPGRLYVIQACSDLIAKDWAEIGTVTGTENGVIEFTDPNGTKNGIRFYRTVLNNTSLNIFKRDL